MSQSDISINITLTRQQSQRLFIKHREVCTPGSGVVRYSQKQIIQQSEYISIVLCTVEEVVSQKPLQNIRNDMKVAIEIDDKKTESSQIFLQYFNQTLSSILNVQKIRTFIFVLKYVQSSSSQMEKIIRFLQIREFSIFIKVESLGQTLIQYQKDLLICSSSLFQKEGIFLEGISLVLSIPKFLFGNQNTFDSLTSLLSVWKRTLPVALGSLILQDWIDLSEKTVFQMHFLKDLKPLWELQFLTQKFERSQNLGCQCIGID